MPDVSPNDAPEGVNVERWRADKREEHRRLVQQAVVRIQQQDPADCDGETRQEIRDPEDKFQAAREWNVRSRDQPGEWDANAKADDLARDRQLECVPDRLG